MVSAVSRGHLVLQWISPQLILSAVASRRMALLLPQCDAGAFVALWRETSETHLCTVSDRIELMTKQSRELAWGIAGASL